MPFTDLRRGLEPVYASVREASGIEFAFDREDRHSHTNTHTFYLRYMGPLPISSRWTSAAFRQTTNKAILG